MIDGEAQDTKPVPVQFPDEAIEAVWSSPALPAQFRGFTPARIGLRRAGVGLATGELLEFQLAHGRARDAVHAKLQPAGLLAALRALREADHPLLHSAAPDRHTYLKRPDLGRKLDQASMERLRNLPKAEYDLSFAVVDGLSALAIERHAVPLLQELLALLSAAQPQLRLAPICVVQQGRVAIGDTIAAELGAHLVVVLIGERPGLSSPDSLGAYITWQPKPGITTDAERNCISNIRAEGLSYPKAASRLMHYITQARARQVTGVALKDPDTKPIALDSDLQHGGETGLEENGLGAKGLGAKVRL